jgi:hypothetical protein
MPLRQGLRMMSEPISVDSQGKEKNRGVGAEEFLKAMVLARFKGRRKALEAANQNQGG